MLGLVQSEMEGGGNGGDTISTALRKKKKRLARTKKKGAVSLRSYDAEKDSAVQESFGGAETVTLLGEESDSDAEVELE